MQRLRLGNNVCAWEGCAGPREGERTDCERKPLVKYTKRGLRITAQDI
jgi:hypothetical protein